MNDFLIIRAETPKMMIAEYPHKKDRVLLQLKKESGIETSISIEDSKKTSNEIIKLIKHIMQRSKLSPEEKMLMLKAIYK